MLDPPQLRVGLLEGCIEDLQASTQLAINITYALLAFDLACSTDIEQTKLSTGIILSHSKNAALKEKVLTSRTPSTSLGMLEELPENAPQLGDPSDITSMPTNPPLQTANIIPGSSDLNWNVVVDSSAERSFSMPKLGPALDMPAMSAPWIGVQGFSEIEAETSDVAIMGIPDNHQNVSNQYNLDNAIAVPGSDITAHVPSPTSTQLLPPRRTFQARRVLRHSALSRIALGQLASFPKMMIQGDRLPPFICPPCHLHEELAFDCVKSRRHCCLPKELAICAGTVEMFYSRTAQNSEFVWKTIYAEIERLQKEHESFDIYQQLAALQCLAIYVLLQAQDVETSEANEASSLLTTTINICMSVGQRNKPGTDTIHETPLWSKWVHEESVRRTITLLVIIDLMMDCLLEPERSVYHACSYNLENIPLPATRDLWEAQSNFVWRTEYERYLSRRQTKKILTIGDLLELDQAGALRDVSRDQKINVVPDILNWCDGLDSLGSLLWTVMPFQQWRSLAGMNEAW
ncbi:hypothetical protein UA08_07124 [Talaromyces atroroseus]|uniref:Transcription factor domain-containing protein n=1 Tax=Talaromyces atroroseus TaxID=1441469 RepID=A0A225ARX8_TALAT|nr:hypothetical protein UA08_07124 [Talaromyces atroroseus]OKL57716.1 hypothetical protein UA08_07124 [Talaromyces atroroseus]